MEKHGDVAARRLRVPGPALLPADLHALRNGAAAELCLGHEHLVHAVDVVLENGLVLAAVQREHELIRGKGNGREEKGRRRVDTAARRVVCSVARVADGEIGAVALFLLLHLRIIDPKRLGKE